MKKRCLLILGLAAIVGMGSYLLMPSFNRDKNAEKREKGKVLRSFRVSGKPTGGKTAMKIPVARRAPKAEPKGGYFEDELFKVEVEFSFDEEKEANLSEELKTVIRDISKAMAGFEPDRKQVYRSLQKLLAMVASGKPEVPSFVKLEALKTIEWLGADALPEALGFLADPDPQVAQKAQNTIMEMMMDFDATEADQVAAIRQLIRLDSLTPEQCESIMFTVSSFRKTSNKVAVGLEVYDHGSANAMAALSNNADFIYEEAAAESIQTRSDIVKYGQDHPDGRDDDLDIKFK